MTNILRQVWSIEEYAAASETEYSRLVGGYNTIFHSGNPQTTMDNASVTFLAACADGAQNPFAPFRLTNGAASFEQARKLRTDSHPSLMLHDGRGFDYEERSQPADEQFFGTTSISRYALDKMLRTWSPVDSAISVVPALAADFIDEATAPGRSHNTIYVTEIARFPPPHQCAAPVAASAREQALFDATRRLGAVESRNIVERREAARAFPDAFVRRRLHRGLPHATRLCLLRAAATTLCAAGRGH